MDKDKQPCEHRRRHYRYGDETSEQWICARCGYENYTQGGKFDEESKEIIDALFGA